MTPEEVLDLWQRAHHRNLTKVQMESFLARDELETICQAAPEAVGVALRRTSRLASAVQELEQIAWWFAGSPCEEDDLGWCSRCKPRPFPTLVFMTVGSSDAFHATQDCRALLDGQAATLRRGGSPADVRHVALNEALGGGKAPCLVCFPWAKGRA